MMTTNDEHLAAGARTVRQLHTHFEELKAAARAMLASGEVRQRGYFTPTQEEACQHLLVSYWHSRNALLELVISLRERARSCHRTFLIGYAGALLLVDAARFLHDVGDGEPVLRRKLNEPSPAFGIPRGVYDTIQHSLTNPVNAWRLFQATEYFESCEPVLRKAAEDEQLAGILPIIDAMLHQVQVPAARYVPARFRLRTRQCVEGVRQEIVGRTLYRLQRMMSELASAISLRPSHRPQLPREITQQIESCIQPGDVFITRKEYALTNYFLPGYWPHAALYVGDAKALEQRGISRHKYAEPRWPRLVSLDPQQPGRVVEALKDGVWIRSLASPLSSDSTVILRPLLQSADIDEAMGRAFAHDGKPYDFDFDFTRSDRLVCTEVVYRAFEGISGVSFQLTRRAGRLTLSAGDLMQMARGEQHFRILAAYVPSKAPELFRDRHAETVVGQILDRCAEAAAVDSASRHS